MAVGNTYFRFRQFTVQQDRCAMKVTTDACIQGAWTPVSPGVKRILDIGAGTGLLSLMMAQRAPAAVIDAVEYDAAAAGQARENVSESAWSDSIRIIEGDVRECRLDHPYDLVICNPPFFNNSLLGERESKNRARHTISLSYDDLLRIISDNLSAEGYASVLLPYEEYNLLKELLPSNKLFETGKLLVRHSADVDVKRVVGLFAKKEAGNNISEELIIKDKTGAYTADFTRLLSPFYLYL